MKSKKIKKKILHELSVMVIAVTFILALIGFGYIVNLYVSSFEDSYVITLEICNNKTIVLGRELINTTVESCGYTRDVRGCMKCKKSCVAKEIFIMRCPNSSECEFDIYGGMSEVYKKEIYMIEHKNYKDITQIETVCGDYETEVLKIKDGFIWHPDTFDICSHNKLKGETELEWVRRCHRISTEDNYIVILKKDLTRDWLDENCDCEEPDVVGKKLCDECKTQYNIGCNCKFDCYLYKCGEYKVTLK